MSFEAATLSFAGMAFIWMGLESVKTRDTVLRITTSLYGDRGLETRVEGMARRLHDVESEVVGLKIMQDDLAKDITRLENRRGV